MTSQREQVQPATMLSRFTLDMLASMSPGEPDLTTPRGRGVVALAARLEGMSWADAAAAANLSSAETARKYARRVLDDYAVDPRTMRDLLILKCEAMFNTAMRDYQQTGSVALLRVAEKVLQRHQSLVPELSTRHHDVVVRATTEPVHGARPEYGGEGRTWYHQVRDGLPLHPDDVARFGLTPDKCEELRTIWAREEELERARLLDA
jgi:hypothetical protein